MARLFRHDRRRVLRPHRLPSPLRRARALLVTFGRIWIDAVRPPRD